MALLQVKWSMYFENGLCNTSSILAVVFLQCRYVCIPSTTINQLLNRYCLLWNVFFLSVLRPLTSYCWNEHHLKCGKRKPLHNRQLREQEVIGKTWQGGRLTMWASALFGHKRAQCWQYGERCSLPHYKFVDAFRGCAVCAICVFFQEHVWPQCKSLPSEVDYLSIDWDKGSSQQLGQNRRHENGTDCWGCGHQYRQSNVSMGNVGGHIWCLTSRTATHKNESCWERRRQIQSLHIQLIRNLGLSSSFGLYSWNGDTPASSVHESWWRCAQASSVEPNHWNQGRDIHCAHQGSTTNYQM